MSNHIETDESNESKRREQIIKDFSTAAIMNGLTPFDFAVIAECCVKSIKISCPQFQIACTYVLEALKPMQGHIYERQ